MSMTCETPRSSQPSSGPPPAATDEAPGRSSPFPFGPATPAAITTAAQQTGLARLFRLGLRTDQDVRDAVSWLREPCVSTRVNCRESGPAHSSPFRFLADVTLGRVAEWIVWANRSGSKSYMAALAVWLRANTYPRLETTILGGSLEQSQKSYKAMDSFWTASGLGPELLVRPPMRRSTAWKSGSAVGILTASGRSVRGPHPQALIMDEVDEMAKDIYDAALSQPQSKYGLPAMLGQLSTNHRVAGVMDGAVERARASETPFYKWCVWECLAPCLDYRCSTCPLAAYCPGEHMKQADGYYAVPDFVSKLRTISLFTLEVEWFCRKVGRSDLVYGEQYDEGLHLIDAGFRPDLPALLSNDWGGTNPFSVGVWQPLDVGWTRVDEVYMGNTTNPAVIAECERRAWWANVPKWAETHRAGGVADPSRPDLFKEWEAAGVKLVAAKTKVDEGVEAVRGAMRPVLGGPRFRVSIVCKDWRREVGSYIQRKGKPVDENNHAMDDTRYFVQWQVSDAPEPRRGRAWAPGIARKAEEKAPQPAANAPEGQAAEAGKEKEDDDKKTAPAEIRQPRRGRIFSAR